MSELDLSILVISYNTRALTLECLRSVFAQTRAARFELIVVDNASADGSADAIAAEFPHVALHRLEQNVGFAAGNNYAARCARGEYLLLLNPDTVVLDRALDYLLAFARANPDAGIFGGRTLFPDGSLNPSSCWGWPTPWSAFCRGVGLSAVFKRSAWFDPESLGRWQRDSIRDVAIVSGCFFLLKRALWDSLDGFDPAFFMYAEEADLCLRAARRGVKCRICPDATIVHHGGASEPVRADKLVRLLCAKALLYRRHWPPAAARFGVAMLDAWVWTRMAGLWPLAQLSGRFRAARQPWCSAWLHRDEWRRAGTLEPGDRAPTGQATHAASPALEVARQADAEVRT